MAVWGEKQGPPGESGQPAPASVLGGARSAPRSPVRDTGSQLTDGPAVSPGGEAALLLLWVTQEPGREPGTQHSRSTQ